LRYTADLQLPGLLHARLVTSLYAHAKLRRVDATAARAVPGVVAVLTAQDMPGIAPSTRGRLLLARDRVIFSGQPVALVIATSEAAAEDGAAQFVLDYEPLPAAITLDEALAEGAPLVWPEGVPHSAGEGGAHGADVGSALKEEKTISNLADHTSYARGDVQAGFAEADVVVEATFNTSMVHQSGLETQSVIAEPNALTGGMTVWASTQAPFDVREAVAAVLDLPESLVKVVGVPVGGGFGAKNGLYEPLAAAAARAVGRPVRLVLTRMEEMKSTVPAPPARIYARLGARADGTLTALSAKVSVDDGCYPSGLAGFLAYMLGSFYRIPNIDLHAYDVLTFKQSAGPYRAPGAPTVTFALDSLMDELAEKLKLDPIEFRLQNAIKAGDPMSDGEPWPAVGMREVLEALRRHPAWQQREQARALGHGVGIAIGGWPGGTEPAAAACTLNRDGVLQVNVSSVDLHGTATTLGLLAAEAFGVPAEKVRVVLSDTDSAPFSGAASGSKVTYTTGAAVLLAARDARQQVLAVAAEALEAAVEDLEIVDGAVRVRGYPNKVLKLTELAQRTMKFGGKLAPIFGSGRLAQSKSAPAFNGQLAEVEVDRETGAVRLHRLVVIQDVGRAINPLTVTGQLQGGAVQGIGWALYEQMEYDAGGQLLTGSWADYAVPGIQQVPPLLETELVEVPSETGPMGARGVGEPPVVPTAAAIANAIANVTGARLRTLPMTAPRILEAMGQKS
jgi:CO/xanthine dehydrogenase Mo-binding subunit